jgi:hypothetical protein
LKTRLASLFRPVDAASLGFLRVTFGLVMLYEVVRYWLKGTIERHFIAPTYFFKYHFFEWVPDPGDSWTYPAFAVLGVAAGCIATGFCYRLAAAVFAAGFAWVFLADQTYYLNHFYLITLVSLLLPFVPAHRVFSLDARWSPHPEGQTAPAWALQLMRFQIAVPYVFGAIAKLNVDWLRGEPMRMWLRKGSSETIWSGVMTWEPVVWGFVWGGILLDFLVVPALLWKRTRVPAYIAALAFHGFNAYFFNIGIFPWLMIAASTIYFEPDWPRRVWARWLRPAPPVEPGPGPVLTPLRRAGLAALGAWVLFQTLMPFRHLLYPGYVSWTEEGHRFAWHMKLRDKKSTAAFTVRDPATGRSWRIEPRDWLTRAQVEEMPDHPEMLLQFARHLSRENVKKGKGPLEVRARVYCSLNGRRPALLVDPEVDLASQPRSMRHWDWIMPLAEDLPRR